MKRFERVVQILDEAIGGPGASIRRHGTFWRGLSRDEFVAHVVFGRPLVVVGQGADSNLVKALKGVEPFDGSPLRRMPAGMPPVPAQSIAIIERWIDDGCPDDAAQSEFTWRPTNAPMADQDAGKRYDDVWFVTADRGWGCNSDGKILRTTDGGTAWTQQFHDADTYFRCLGFASETLGWAGTLSGPARLLRTEDGETWNAVDNLPADPRMICGLSVVNASVVCAAGTNYPSGFVDNPPAAVMRTLDGGASWSTVDMSAHATLLVDTFFTTPERGWVVGGLADPTVAPGPDGRDNITPVVLLTEDGGQSWVNRVADLKADFPHGEWGWKIQFLTDQIGYVSLENFKDGAILKTSDGGTSWARLEIDDPQQNANLEGVGFIDEAHGWVGGWGTQAFVTGESSATNDGGRSWINANEVGKFINRFRFVGTPVTVAYAAGATVYKYSDAPVPAALADGGRILAAGLLDGVVDTDDVPAVRIPVAVPDGASRLAVNVWERFGRHAAQVVDEPHPAPGPRTVEWDATGRSGSFIVRVSVDDDSESQIIRLGSR
jgi:photosystem II stability/assembly factor-like uncharacterized protein